ncbi:chemotaxis protein CheW [uncultured Methylibium sp.]|uniref:chemotaxis protein CheW n=1 Tax=uncultured Methylibium sp. TaxID=381093 RepID=UPI0025DA362B|nr:chemotaxis protein CheW [uncultured Methylibium sp.]
MDRSSEAQAYGLMRIDATPLALPVASLREVIPCPERLAPLPVPAAGVCGAVRLRGSIIPVLDLRQVLGLPPAAEGGGCVVVLMRHEGRLLGLRVSAVSGMARVAGDRLHALDIATPAGAGIATHSFETEDGVATLLDAGRIAGLPGVPMVVEPSGGSRDGAVGAREPLLLFRCGGLPFGIAAMSVDATVPRIALRDNALVGELCRGVIDHHGHEVPVIDTLRLLGLGQAANPAESAVVVLRFAQGLLGLMLDEVRDIAQVAAAEILPLQPLGLRDARLFRGVLGARDGHEDGGQGHGEQHLLLDAGALQADEILSALAGLSRPKAARDAREAAVPGTAQAGVALGGRPYLTYQVEVETASPLTQASEILVYPAHAVPLHERRDATLGLFTHRGSAVPLVCLGTLLGRPTVLDASTARVLIVEDGGQRVGLVVQALCSIENARWEQPVAEGEAASLDSMRGLQPLVEVGAGEQHRTLPRLDLVQLVRALRCEAAHSATVPEARPTEPAALSAPLPTA